MKIPYSEIVNLLQNAPDWKTISDIFSEIGLPVESIEKLDDDTIFDIEIPSNRGDLLSVYEVIRQISIYLETLGLTQSNSMTDFSLSNLESLDIEFKYDTNILEIKNSEFAPLYYGVIFRTKVKESSYQFKKRIQKLGFNHINNIVDITNFICAYYGQPMHAFDYSKIKDGKIIVRKSQDGEKFIGLDRKERILNKNIGVIADSEKIIALAGIMGSYNSETNFNTNVVFLECANFKQQDIYYATRHTGIETESAYRFKRGIPHSFAMRAITAFFNLLKNEVKIEKGICYSTIKEPAIKIYITYDFINQRIGTTIPRTTIKKILNKLDCKLEEDKDTLIVEPPSFRKDLQIKEDLLEEIAKFFGYKNLSNFTTLKITNAPVNIYDQKLSEIKKYLANNGFFECISSSFVERRLIEKLKLDKNNFIQVNAIKNPDKFLRTRILFTLLEVYRNNLSYGFEKINLFEIGKVFNNSHGNFNEVENLCIISNYHNTRNLKEFVCNIFKLIGSKYSIINYQDMLLQNSFAVFSCKSSNENAELLGCGGEIKKTILLEFEIKFSDIYYVELNIGKILSEGTIAPVYKNIANFPPLKIDISFILDGDLEYKTIKDFLENMQINHLAQFELIDVFTNPKIGTNKKSYTLRLYFQHPEKTLQKKEVQMEIERIFNQLKTKFGIIKRE